MAEESDVAKEFHNATDLNASDVVTQVALVHARLNMAGQRIKPRSSLPCSWFSVRECFVTAYEEECLQLSKADRENYHYVYRELAFFVDDELFKKFSSSLDVAAQCRAKRLRDAGKAEEVEFSRKVILVELESAKIQDRDAIYEHLARENTCPTRDLVLIAETLVYCGWLYRLMWDEWVAFANLIEYSAKAKELE